MALAKHPFVAHYEENDEAAQNAQHLVILHMFTECYGESRDYTVRALTVLGWDEKEAQRAVNRATKDV